MQRRAAAVSAVVFLVIAAGAYAFIGAAQEPSIEVDADQTVTQGQTLTVGGTEYNFSSVDGEAGQATVTWVNQSARHTTTMENNSTVAYQSDQYRLLVPNGTNVSEFTLREEQNVSAIVANDTQVDGIVTDEGGTRYVRYTNGSTVPLDDYLPPRDTAQFSTGDQFPYQNNTTTVTAVESSGVTLAWTAPRTNSVDVAEGGNVTLGDQTYVAHFEGNQLLLSSDYEAYRSEAEAQTYFHERISGLWGITILATIAAILLLGLAYLPERY